MGKCQEFFFCGGEWSKAICPPLILDLSPPPDPISGYAPDSMWCISPVLHCSIPRASIVRIGFQSDTIWTQSSALTSIKLCSILLQVFFCKDLSYVHVKGVQRDPITLNSLAALGTDQWTTSCQIFVSLVFERKQHQLLLLQERPSKFLYKRFLRQKQCFLTRKREINA